MLGLRHFFNSNKKENCLLQRYRFKRNAIILHIFAKKSRFFSNFFKFCLLRENLTWAKLKSLTSAGKVNIFGHYFENCQKYSQSDLPLRKFMKIYKIMFKNSDFSLSFVFSLFFPGGRFFFSI